MTAVVTFVAVYLLHIVLMARIMWAINGRTLYGVALGLFAAVLGGLWLAASKGILPWLAHTNPSLLYLASVLPGHFYYFEYMRARPREDTIRNLLSDHVELRSFMSGWFVCSILGTPVLGIAACTWVLSGRIDDYFKPR